MPDYFAPSRELVGNSDVQPPGSWRDSGQHYRTVLSDPWYRHMLVLQDAIVHATVDHFRNKGARAVLMPLTTRSVSSPMGLGSDSLPVEVNINGIDVFLADSMQFMLELGVRVSGGESYYILPSFRGEPTDPRHLAQFYHVESELPGSFEDVRECVESYIWHLLTVLYEGYCADIEPVAGGVQHLAEAIERGIPFPHITYDEAVEELTFPGALDRREDLDFPVITELGEQALVKRYGDFTWLTHYPSSLVPFYQAEDPGQPGRALTLDLLAGIGEILGAGERHQHSRDLLRSLKEHAVDPADYGWYLDMKQVAPMQTAGFGLGLERFLLWVTRHSDIRDIPVLPVLETFDF